MGSLLRVQEFPHSGIDRWPETSVRNYQYSLKEVIPLCADSIYSIYKYIFQSAQLYSKGMS